MFSVNSVSTSNPAAWNRLPRPDGGRVEMDEDCRGLRAVTRRWEPSADISFFGFGTRIVCSFPLTASVDVCTQCAYTRFVGFEWDEPSKAGIDFRRHGVRMPEGIPVFEDPYGITIPD